MADSGFEGQVKDLGEAVADVTKTATKQGQ